MKKPLIIAVALGLLASLIPGTAQAEQWDETTLFEQVIARETEEQNLHVAYIRGAPNDSNPSFYDVTVGVSDQLDQTFSLDTKGLVQEEFEIRILYLPKSTNSVHLRAFARRDLDARGNCLVDQGGFCAVRQPFSDAGWLANNGRRAGLGLTLSAERNGETLAKRTVVVPFAGQLIP